MAKEFQIEKLQLPPDLQGSYSVVVRSGENERVLPSLSQINFFVGSNNSGKSRLLRGLLKVDKHQLLPRKFPTGAKDCAEYLQSEIAKLCGPDSELQPFNRLLQALPSFELFTEGGEGISPLLSLIQETQTLGASEMSLHNKQGIIHGLQSHPNIIIKVREIGVLAKAHLKLDSSSAELLTYKRIYIPTLRGLRPVGNSNDDFYHKRTVEDYLTSKTSAEIFTGQKFYDDLRDLLLGERVEREAARKFEDFLSRELFGDVPVTLIPKKNSRVVHIRLGNERERAVHELGDGIQHLIILTFPLFQNQNKPGLVFIEEPELFLHPGMQRSLIKAMRGFENYQFFIGTHSNHLLDLTLEFEDISIYMVRKEIVDSSADEFDAKFVIEPASTHDHRILEILGTRASSVFLSNCTVWVEGITDRRYILHGLKLHYEHLCQQQKAKNAPHPFEPRADLHFSFVEYSGGNITHWSFLDRVDDPIEVTRLCSRLMLIADKDSSKAKNQRHLELKDHLGDNFICLASIEIENLLTPSILKKILYDYNENLSVLTDFEQDSYKDEKLGTFLESQLKKTKREGGYAEESGTIKAKLDFCSKAISHQKTWADLSPEAQALIEKIYLFIREHNRSR